MKIAAEGTFFYCKGAIATDGWVLDCEGGDVATQDEVLKLIVKYLYAKIVEVPELQAKLASLKALEQAKGTPGA